MIETEETTMLSQQENLNEEILEEFSLLELDLKENLVLPNNILTKLINNLTIDKDEVFTRIDPLVGITRKEKLKEIIT